jgi:hypothetical protein
MPSAIAGISKQPYPQPETLSEQRIAGTAGIAGVKSHVSLIDDEDEALLPRCQNPECGRPIHNVVARARGICHRCQPVTLREEAEHHQRQAVEQKAG